MPRSARDSVCTGFFFAAMMPFSEGYRGSLIVSHTDTTAVGLPKGQCLFDGVLVHLVDHVVGRVAGDRPVGGTKGAFGAGVRHLLDEGHDVHGAATTSWVSWSVQLTR